jgi:hypothetical protein
MQRASVTMEQILARLDAELKRRYSEEYKLEMTAVELLRFRNEAIADERERCAKLVEQHCACGLNASAIIEAINKGRAQGGREEAMMPGSDD